MSHYIQHIAGEFDPTTMAQYCTRCGNELSHFIHSGDLVHYEPGLVYRGKSDTFSSVVTTKYLPDGATSTPCV